MAQYKGFTTVKLKKPQRSMFDLSHENRLSTLMGKLTPIFCLETIPNDTFKINPEVLLRLAPTLSPVYQRINCFLHVFYVPNRLIWEEWEDFITAGRLGTDTPVPPWVLLEDLRVANHLTLGSLADYLGFPVDESITDYSSAQIDCMPFAAFYKIWYDYYRDRNFVADNEVLPLPSGRIETEINDICTTRNRSWQHDYFTSSLPFTQRGAEVLMPLSGSGTVTYLDQSELFTNDGTPLDQRALIGNDLGNTGADGLLQWQGAGPTDNAPAGGAHPARLENIDEVLLDSSSVSINDLRQAVRLQEWYERNALAGSRYNESIMAHFGRRTSDSRLQRAEYLGGSKLPVKISEVITTAYSEDADTNSIPPGTMVGHGIAYGDNASITYNCEEHGFIIGIMSIMPQSGYMQGLPRMFKRPTFLEYPWPSFANLGEQPVYDYEIYADNTAMIPVAGEYPIWGYQSRYSDWKNHQSHAHGDFRDSLDFWHLVRKFATPPTLNTGFLNFGIDEQMRIFAVQDGTDTCWAYIHNNITVKRSLPYYGTPTL